MRNMLLIHACVRIHAYEHICECTCICNCIYMYIHFTFTFRMCAWSESERDRPRQREENKETSKERKTERKSAAQDRIGCSAMRSSKGTVSSSCAGTAFWPRHVLGIACCSSGLGLCGASRCAEPRLACRWCSACHPSIKR